MSRGVVVVVIAGLFACEGRARAADQPSAPAASVQDPLRFTLDPAAPAPDARIATRLVPEAQLDTGVQSALAAKLALRAAETALRTAELVRRPESGAVWNCGMPVVTPPAAIDPRFERQPTDTTTFHIRRTAPPTCGR
jgi:hypothetical protein